MLISLLLIASAAPPTATVPLQHAHAHNDYAHPRPLFDALEFGFTSVEADVFLVKQSLLVGHFWTDLRESRTLESLYLEPLARRTRANKGVVYTGSDLPFFLHIDIKTQAQATYEVVDRLLKKYDDVFSVFQDGKFTRRAVTVVISGNVPREEIAAQKVRYAGIDGRPGDLDSDEPAHLIPIVSASWGSQFRWRGDGEMPKGERDALRTFVEKAHKRGRLVRFWATPEKPTLWRELRTEKVDFINTDKRRELHDFLRSWRVGR